MKLAAGSAYAVTAKTPPSFPAQTCTVTNGTGTVGNADVTNVSIACATNTYPICPTVSGLEASTGDAGLAEAGLGGLVITNNGAAQAPVIQPLSARMGRSASPPKLRAAARTTSPSRTPRTRTRRAR